MKIWYAPPGKSVVPGYTVAHDFPMTETVVIRIPDPYDAGECEITVPRKHLLTSIDLGIESIEDLDLAWDEVYTKVGYNYSPTKELDARAWFYVGYKYQKR